VREILRHENVQNVTMVEIDGEVIEACKKHLPQIASAFGNPKLNLIVDDGIATGHTLLAGIQQIRKKQPAKIIVAIPVAPPDAIKNITKRADEIVVLHQPEYFTGISAFYEDFKQLTTEEAAAYLKNNHPYWLD
jgi:predicted phosphoribosyltransferase